MANEFAPFFLRIRVLVVIYITLVTAATSAPLTNAFSGSAALEATRQATAFGERYSGSAENTKLRNWIWLKSGLCMVKSHSIRLQGKRQQGRFQ